MTDLGEALNNDGARILARMGARLKKRVEQKLIKKIQKNNQLIIVQNI